MAHICCAAKRGDKIFIAPRRQERKGFFFELGRPFDFAQDMLCVLARVSFFPVTGSSPKNFKQLG